MHCALYRLTISFVSIMFLFLVGCEIDIDDGTYGATATGTVTMMDGTEEAYSGTFNVTAQLEPDSPFRKKTAPSTARSKSLMPRFKRC